MQRNTGHVDKLFLKVDFQNAFNTVDRAALLRQVRLRLPGLAPWAEWCYDHHSRLLFHGEAVSSEAGVQQGDPLGPLLFALTLQPALQAAQAGAPGSCPELAFAFLDDVCLVGGSRQVAGALTRLAASARQVGLQLRPDKCELVACAGPDAVVDRSLFLAGIRVNQTGAMSLLGAAIGPSHYTENYIMERVAKAQVLLAALADLPDPQTGLLLLRHCAAFCRVVYALRVTPSELLGRAAATFDDEVRACLERLCTGPLTAEAWSQASLSVSLGGLGLRQASRHAPAAYLASIMTVRNLCPALDGAFRPDWVGTAAALENLNRDLALSSALRFSVKMAPLAGLIVSGRPVGARSHTSQLTRSHARRDGQVESGRRRWCLLVRSPPHGQARACHQTCTPSHIGQAAEAEAAPWSGTARA